ncbi:MAG: hypothetical protein H7Z10_01990 [Gemmatimonadaceae bacterium]|nr:hypothetical protein [Acetobacteraceae bacterium]
MGRMMILFGVLAVTGCYGYEPPVTADRTAPQYQADLAACQDESVDAVNKRNAKTGLDWFSSPVRRLFQIRAAIRECVAAKGYGATG